MNERERLGKFLEERVITAREYQILELRYVYEFSQYTTANALEVSRSTVKSAEKNALEKIERHERKAA